MAPAACPVDCGPICDVWQHNLEEAFCDIQEVIQTHKYVSLDTEFPGVVEKPSGEYESRLQYTYQLVRQNVNRLKLIQIGISFFDEKGNPASPVSTWQFNLRFNAQTDEGAVKSLNVLAKSGIDFERHSKEGILPENFGELIMMSGVVLDKDVSWITFHCSFDFGYMVRLLTGQCLEPDFSDFQEFLKYFFPTIYDLKHIVKYIKNMRGGLQDIADSMQIKRIGTQHQAGSDSLLTGQVFFKINDEYFEGTALDKVYSGVLYGFGACETSESSENSAEKEKKPTASQEMPSQEPVPSGRFQTSAVVAALP